MADSRKISSFRDPAGGKYGALPFAVAAGPNQTNIQARRPAEDGLAGSAEGRGEE
jgi:hypothetical protein